MERARLLSANSKCDSFDNNKVSLKFNADNSVVSSTHPKSLEFRRCVCPPFQLDVSSAKMSPSLTPQGPRDSFPASLADLLVVRPGANVLKKPLFSSSPTLRTNNLVFSRRAFTASSDVFEQARPLILTSLHFLRNLRRGQKIAFRCTRLERLARNKNLAYSTHL